MIRRQEADRFYLIAQNDHALLSGQVAAHYGNQRFTRANPATETLRAASLHDCGWPLHDERPQHSERRASHPAFSWFLHEYQAFPCKSRLFQDRWKGSTAGPKHKNATRVLCAAYD